MEKALFTLQIILFSLSLSVLGQSVVITPKKVTYTRPNTNSQFKETFTVTYPKISGTSTKLIKKIEDSISFKKVLSFNLQNERFENNWLEVADYTVSYNQNWILSIYLSMEGTAAYPTFFGKSAVVDLKTGNRVTIQNVLTNLSKLVSTIRKIQKAEIEDSIKEIKSNPDFKDTDVAELFKFAEFKRIHLEDFSVQKDGIAFHYNYSFPRYYLPIEPGGNYLLSWKELKPFIRKGSLFAQFVK
ncbi:MAG: DUF4163 domain-containing protein [Pyrinomonadaceae bacterium]|nr:DUF4163 domain-containing protein [Pyrinomonadaceae bacterium]